MDTRVPPPLRAPLAHYAELARSAFGDALVGVFVHGSVALDAFDARGSDVDFLTVVRHRLDDGECARVATLHRELRRATPWGARLEGVYAAAGDLPAAGARGAGHRHPYVKRGRHRAGWTHELPAVARLMVRERGVAVWGTVPAAALIPPVSRSDLDAEMWYNLNVYWARQADRAYQFLYRPAADFAAATLPRVLHTLETGEIISKPQALALLAERFPEWGPLASPGLGRLARARTTVAFIRAMIERGNGRARPAAGPAPLPA